MYTVLENARIVIALLKKHNIRHIVLSPGGSNIPIVQGVQQDPFFKCYSVVDERSAIYFAIGLHHETGEIIATSCTSAQATRNYIPGLTEAYYKRVPILAITMSKHPRYLGQDYMQCPYQTSLPIDAVKKSFSLPRINDENDRALCIRTVNEAILELTHHSHGPIQLNIEELDSETWQLSNDFTLPEVRCINRYSYNSCDFFSLKGKKVMLLIGEHRVFSDATKSAIETFCEKNNVFVYSHHISNYHGKYALNANAVVSFMSKEIFNKIYAPDVLITIGGLTGDYGIYTPLFNSPSNSFEHWRIDRGGNVVDTYGKLTKVFEMEEEEFFNRYSSLENINDHSYFELWNNAMKQVNTTVDVPLSNLYVAQYLHKLIPSNSRMNFAILNSFRVWSYFQIDPSIVCAANVAAYGIDGCMSLLLGQSVETENLSFLITGDLAFYYDMNALSLRHVKNSVRIILINNDGGAEFKLGNLEKKTDVSSHISAAGHFKTAKGWAETCGFEYIQIKEKGQLEMASKILVKESQKPILLEVFTTAENERIAISLFAEANRLRTKKEEMKSTAKKVVKEVLGEKVIDDLKDIVESVIK